MPRTRGDASLRRKRGVRRERARVLIVTEGTETETQYFKGLARIVRATGVDVVGLDVVGVGRDPATVVEVAAERSGRIRSRGPSGDKYDQVWCVVDVDTHTTLEQAVRAAAASNISMAVTNPCFELWLLWHFQDFTRYADGNEVQRELETCGVGKHIPRDFPFAAFAEAAGRAHAAGEACASPGPPTNPGSSVCALVRVIERGAAP